jgi:RHS repeat-associated protein
MTYNNEGQLSNWQDRPSSPTSTAAFLYDGEGHRVVQQTTSGTTTTTTVYVGDLEQDATTGSTTTKTTYYYANGHRIATAVNGSFSYLASDGLGSANVSLDSKGSVTASVLYAPYGSPRYSSGTMPTVYGFTGQIGDSTSGLDYYGARYYDPVLGQFTSADTVLPGGGFDVWALSRYAYAEGNPIIRTDPTGRWTQMCVEETGCSTSEPPSETPSQSTGGSSTTDGGVGQSPSSNSSSFLTTVSNHVFGLLNRATNPSVQSVNHGVAGDLDSWWDLIIGLSPPGILSNLGLGPSLRDPLANLDRAAGGQASSTSEYQTGQLVGGVSQIAMVFTPGGAAANATRTAERLFVSTAEGHTVPVPSSFIARVADNGAGIVYQRSGATGNADLVRIMDPIARYPQGYMVYYNALGKALDAAGGLASRARMHIPLDQVKGAQGYYMWLEQFLG